ncbi:cytochrome c5 family protein [Ectothiorhodospiraceae bacterium BW-2]|nr:cytochrome c5 family protein [Ectothiorhodospiraceae bacterium BW-2]
MKKITSILLGSAMVLASHSLMAADGKATYDKFCVNCHMTGAANSPKLGDTAAWAPRIAKGMDALMQSALNGIPGTAMLPKGTCMTCTEDDLRAAVEYMISQSQ